MKARRFRIDVMISQTKSQFIQKLYSSNAIQKVTRQNEVPHQSRIESVGEMRGHKNLRITI